MRAMLTALLVLVMCSISLASSVILEWDINAEPYVVGYKVYYGYASGEYSVVMDVGNFTTCVVVDPYESTEHFFTTTANTESVTESDYSNEVPCGVLFLILT